MLATQSVIDIIAGRIERAYRRRNFGRGVCYPNPRLWAVAAETLLQAREADDSLPLDPELFVASQPDDPTFVDPWTDLTGGNAVRRFTGQVTGIVLGLRGELTGEVRYAEGRIARGRSVDQVLLANDHRLSPLGRYLVALRASRPALAGRFRQGAAEQHRSCPLYRPACAEFLDGPSYPVPDGFEATAPAPYPIHRQLYLLN